ncbi:glycosyltransferase [Pedobacter chitinilyticus]|uniref:Glycosyltransferase subfamily 4-like N-terminal domain-containing protein n=1 Tax=Pedobacter chitinilyticus TaxID=2233776 RepID=A0A3S3PUS3_9SPHI|nr:glycosyltransferase [Pedobacter chitinilyticus]RWU08603.1 hypothetical protein DPV69_09550 [Pedobacter chitinilyticus]
MLKRILFVHDQIPGQGISGMIIFYRHFVQLTDYEIHILVPDYCHYDKSDLPPNFYIHYFSLRKKYWPPFREQSSLLRNIRITQLSKLIVNKLDAIQPSIVITVLYHYFAVATFKALKKRNIPLITFLHDNWMLKTNSLHLKKVRKKLGSKIIERSNLNLSVTRELINEYSSHSNASDLFYPIPAGFTYPYAPSKNRILNLFYAGTIEEHHFKLFEKLAEEMNKLPLKFSIITNSTNKLEHLTDIQYVPSFKTNTEAIKYMHDNADCILVNYGRTFDENPYAATSFPSKFIEFSHLSKPILAVAPFNSPFKNFLESKNYDLCWDGYDLSALEIIVTKLLQPDIYLEYAKAIKKIALEDFSSFHLQNKFKNYLISLEKKNQNET